MNDSSRSKFKRFSIKARLKSFSYAFNGLRYVFQSQHNTWIHAGCAFLVIGLGFFFKISLKEWCWISIAIGFVFLSELFNTSIEILTDLVSPDYNAKAGLIKDISSAAVLVSAITALVIGLIIFLPKLLIILE